MSNKIYVEIEELWRSYYAKAHREPPSRKEFSDLCAELEAENRSKAVTGLQPWLSVLEFGIEWLSSVHIAMSDKSNMVPKETHVRVPWALIGAAVSFGLSIRSLCHIGHDTPARALLRSYVECLFLCLAALNDRALADEYARAHDEAEIKNFWHKTASPKNLHNRIIKIERQIGFSDDVIKEMADWRRQEYEILSQASHLSYVGACMTVFAHDLGGEEILRVAMLGRATDHSIRTLLYAAATTWYFSRLSFDLLLGHPTSDNCLLVFDKDDDMQFRLVIGRDILSQIFLSAYQSEHD